MSELTELITKRDEILLKVRNIEIECEGIENEHNSERVNELFLEQAQLKVHKSEIQEELNAVNRSLSSISDDIAKISEIGKDRILKAIKNQRWYFFKNKTKVLMDSYTGLLWANLDYFDYKEPKGKGGYSPYEIESLIKDLKIDEYKNWKIPSHYDICHAVGDKKFPFMEGKGGQIRGMPYWSISDNEYRAIDLRDKRCIAETEFGLVALRIGLGEKAGIEERPFILPCCDFYIQNSDYEKNVSPKNSIYNEKERLQFTLDLFVKNKLMVIFDDDEITQLYKSIYFENPDLLEELQELESKIKMLQTENILSSDFDYTVLLRKYDIKAINESIIKYYQAVQQWSCELIDKLDYYESKMESVIRDFNIISMKLSKSYENSSNLTEEENFLLSERQLYFQKRFSLGMYDVKSKLIAVKKQADDLEYRIDEIDRGDDAIRQLALIEKEERASFAFIAENSSKIVKNALLKMEYFQDKHHFVVNSIEIWKKWSENYRTFKTKYRENLKMSCEEDGIEEEIFSSWYESWQSIRFAVEGKIQPIIEYGLKSNILTISKTDISIPELLIAALDNYKNSVDNFFMEERKGIYQKFAFQSGGELQDKFESESELYKCTISLQSDLQDIIFNCVNVEDRIFILRWANSLLDIQIDEILSFVADNDLNEISKETISEFSTLKQKNYDIYLADAKAYGAEKSRREKEYNSLIFRMRKDLKKQ